MVFSRFLETYHRADPMRVCATRNYLNLGRKCKTFSENTQKERDNKYGEKRTSLESRNSANVNKSRDYKKLDNKFHHHAVAFNHNHIGSFSCVKILHQFLYMSANKII